MYVAALTPLVVMAIERLIYHGARTAAIAQADGTATQSKAFIERTSS
jgi:hypothetical protein